MKRAVGIDLGGTNIRACLIDEAGKQLAVDSGAVPKDADAELLVTLIVDRVAAVRRTSACEGVGLALAGVLDARGCLVAGMTNLPALAGVPLAKGLKGRLGLSIKVENDARAALLGEARFGAAIGVANVLMLTLGTGIGGGLLLDGKLRTGPRGLSGEIGLSLTPDGSGRRSEGAWVALEDVASPGGLKRTRRLDLEATLAGLPKGERKASEMLAGLAERLAVAIVNAHVVLDLELVVLAGGLTRLGPPLREAVDAAVRRLAPPAFRDNLAIELTGLGAWAGAMGAAALLLPAPRKVSRRR